MNTYIRFKNNLEGSLDLFKNNGIYYIRHESKKGKLYIGSTFRFSIKKCKKGIYGRLVEHLSKLKNNTHHSTYLQNVFNKYGIEGIKCGIIEIVDDKDSILDREQFFMDLYKSYNQEYGYNMSKKSSRPCMSEEQRNKCSIRMKDKNPMSNKTCVEKVRKTRMENNINPILQFDRDGLFIKEYKNISEASKYLNVDASNIYRAMQGQAKTSAGYIFIKKENYTDNLLNEKKLKIREKYSPNDEVVAHTALLLSKTIHQYSMDNVYIQSYNSLKEASIQNKIDRTGISRAANGIQKKCGGYKWKF